MRPPPSAVQLYPNVHRWLELQREVGAMSQEDALQRLEQITAPEGPGQQFYYGLLKHQLNSYGAWIQARDVFQALREDDALSAHQKDLVQLLLQFNQSRINWQSKYSALLEQQGEVETTLEQVELEKSILEQKIQALTELESAISTRKEE